VVGMLPYLHTVELLAVGLVGAVLSCSIQIGVFNLVPESHNTDTQLNTVVDRNYAQCAPENATHQAVLGCQVNATNVW
jgi:hypothetical protein